MDVNAKNNTNNDIDKTGMPRKNKSISIRKSYRSV